jgi:hypothetical protein
MSKAYPKPFYAFPDDVRRIIYTTDEIDKDNFASHDMISSHRRSRGKQWGLRMQTPRRSLYRRSSIAAPVPPLVWARLGPFGVQRRAI